MCKGGLLLNNILPFSRCHQNTADHRFLLKPEFLQAACRQEENLAFLLFQSHSGWQKLSPEDLHGAISSLATLQSATTYMAISRGEPIKMYKLKASGKEHHLGNGLLGNLANARAPWKSALNTTVVQPVSLQLCRRKHGQGLAEKMPGCMSL